MTSRTAPAIPTAIRPEIQALRAIAVAIVVVYHLWPDVLPGGFVGVDVFFAISGYLITAHLLREAERDGGVSLPRFWARRARRLLPAALTALLCCAVATIVLVPQLHWQQFLAEVAASAAYVQNWQLAGDAVDYLAAANRASPVQHFWSLSVEEQFYVAWPVLILVAAACSRNRPAGARRAAITVVLATVTAASLAYSITETAANPAAAYFVTPTRAWEFGAGGLLALAGLPTRSPVAVRALLSWLGLAAVLTAALAYSDATPFPGVAALLPVLGALGVMAAGAPAARWAPTPLMALRPMQVAGDISYSVYLWHWPLLVLAPFAVTAGELQTRAAVLVLTVLMAWCSTRWIEDPVRRGAFLAAARPRLTFAFAAASMALVGAVVAGASWHVNTQIDRAERASASVLARAPACFGAAARDPARPCENPSLQRKVVPSPVTARDEDNAPCTRMHRADVISVCEFGVPAELASRTVALVGDSHAAHWRATLESIAGAERWHGVSITRTSCPFSRATKALSRRASARCVEWNDELPGWFARHPEIDTVFVAANTGGAVGVPRGRTPFEAKMAGYRSAWRSLPASVRRIVVIRDNPKARADTVDCVDRALALGRRSAVACAVPRRDAVQRDAAAVAARRPGSDRARVVDMTRVLCDRRTCPPVIGGALVYKDEHHLTRVFAATLGPLMRRRIERMMPPEDGDRQRASQPRRTASATVRPRCSKPGASGCTPSGSTTVPLATMRSQPTTVRR